MYIYMYIRNTSNRVALQTTGIAGQSSGRMGWNSGLSPPHHIRQKTPPERLTNQSKCMYYMFVQLVVSILIEYDINYIIFPVPTPYVRGVFWAFTTAINLNARNAFGTAMRPIDSLVCYLCWPYIPDGTNFPRRVALAWGNVKPGRT